MIKKVLKNELNKEIADKLKNLFIDNRVEYVVIGENIYELYPLPAIVVMQILKELTLLQDKLNKDAINVDTEKENIINIFKKYIKGIDDEDWNKITHIQLTHFINGFFKVNLGLDNNMEQNLSQIKEEDILQELKKQSHNFQLG